MHSVQATRAPTAWNDEAFSEQIHHVRQKLMQDDFAYFPLILDHIFLPGGSEIWYGDTRSSESKSESEKPPIYYLKVIGAPGTLAGDILRMKADIPRYNCNLEIIGNNVREVEPKYAEFTGVDPNLEDCSEEVAKLPLIAFDPEKHFKKSPTYKQEIRYLLQCRDSPRIVQLLGRSDDGALVFPKFERPFMHTLYLNKDQGRIQNIKRWMLQIIDGVAYLHSLGIIHRDLTYQNILEEDPLVICDLQCLNATGHCRAFEIDAGGKFSFASDVFALGALLWECCFYNAPRNRYVLLDNPPPPPFRDIFLACTQVNPEDRPTLTQLRAMYEAVIV